MQTSKFSLVADATLDGQSFLARTLVHGDEIGRIDTDKSKVLSDDIAAIAHKLITMKVVDLSDESDLRSQIQTAFALTSLGLEFGSKGNLDKAVSVMLANPVVKFYQIGNTLTDEILTRAKHLLDNAVIRPPENLSHLDIDSIRIYNHAEAEFLDAIASYYTTITTARVKVQEKHPPRTFTNLSDIAIIRQQLDYIETRRHYVQALPLEDIFTIDPPLSIAIDPIQTLTLSLMANLTLYYEPDMQLEADTLSDFRDIIYDDSSGEIRPAPRQRLFDWIENYLEQDNQPDDVKNYTLAYWDACLQELADPDVNFGLLM